METAKPLDFVTKNYQVAEIEVKYSAKIKKEDRVKITRSKDSAKLFRDFMGEDQIEMRESFLLMILNRANDCMGIMEVGAGGVAGCVADPKLIFSTALKTLASGIIVCHNHPSGNLNLSQADIDLTRKLKEAGKFLEIQLLDHIILSPEIDQNGNGKYYSFADNGMI